MLAALLAAALAVVPNPATTPGAVNPAVTQATIRQTICVKGWTATIRPKVSYTDALKHQQLVAMGMPTADPRSFEEDHLISLELGGHPSDPHNLWPEPWDGPLGAHKKDVLETRLKTMVCAGQLTLVDAQTAIRTDWVAAYHRYVAP